MGKIIVAIVLAAWTVKAGAAASCTAVAQEKKLAGAALNSFMEKCATDAQSACAATAKEKNLARAARESFTKKCLADAVGGK